MGTVARLFNFITKTISGTAASDKAANPNNERFVTSTPFEISQNPRISRTMSLEARRRGNGMWDIQRVTMIHNRGSIGSIAHRPDFDVTPVMTGVRFETVLERLVAFDRNMKMAKLQKALAEDKQADLENVHRVKARIQDARRKAQAALQGPDAEATAGATAIPAGAMAQKSG